MLSKGNMSYVFTFPNQTPKSSNRMTLSELTWSGKEYCCESGQTKTGTCRRHLVFNLKHTKKLPIIKQKSYTFLKKVTFSVT